MSRSIIPHSTETLHNQIHCLSPISDFCYIKSFKSHLARKNRCILHTSAQVFLNGKSIPAVIISLSDPHFQTVFPYDHRTCCCLMSNFSKSSPSRFVIIACKCLIFMVKRTVCICLLSLVSQLKGWIKGIVHRSIKKFTCILYVYLLSNMTVLDGN